MKLTKKQKKYLGLGILLLVVGYIGLTQLGFITIPYLDLQKQTTIWMDIPVNLESVYFGTISSGVLEFQPIKEGFCGNNDAETTITNTYNVGNSFTMYSSMSSADGTASSCGDNFNYIIAEFIIPPGNLTAVCDTTAKGFDYSFTSSSACLVEGNNNKLFESAVASWEVNNLVTIGVNSETKTLTFNEPTNVKITLSSRATDQKNDPAYANANIILNFEPLQISEPPKPQPKGWFWWISSINDWIVNLFKKLFGLSITGLTEVEPNTIQTYKINMSTPVPDSDYSDGNISYQFGYWGILDSSNKTLQAGNPEDVNGSYVKEITISTPSDPGNYLLIGFITQIDGVYNTSKKSIGQCSGSDCWEFAEETIINKEAISIKNKYIIEPPIKPNPGLFEKFIQAIKNFLCGAFGWFC